MMHLITGYAGYEHIQSEDEGAYNAAFFGDGQYVMESGNQFEGSILDNNTVRILDGDMLMYGRHARMKPNTYEDITITTGTAGMNRIDLICVTYAKNENDGTEDTYFQVIKGTETEGAAVVPAYTDGNILEGATFNQMPLYKVILSGVVLQEIVPMFTVIPTYKTLAEKYAAEFEKVCNEQKEAALDTMEEIEANTEEKQLAGALAVKELSLGLSQVATTSQKGLMSAADKAKIDGIEKNANNYSLPTASSSTLGGVKTSSNVTSNSGYTACPIIEGIPYYKDTNTTYSNASLGQGYGTCATAAATAAKVVTLSGYTLIVGGYVGVKFTYSVPANATMNINSKGAKAIYYKGAAITSGVINAGDTAIFLYNGSQYHLIAIDTDRAKITSLESAMNGLSLAVMTESAYDAIENPDENTLYLQYEE